MSGKQRVSVSVASTSLHFSFDLLPFDIETNQTAMMTSMVQMHWHCCECRFVYVRFVSSLPLLETGSPGISVSTS